MSHSTGKQPPSFDGSSDLAGLVEALRQRVDSPHKFWPFFLESVCRWSQAQSGQLYVRSGTPQEGIKWVAALSFPRKTDKTSPAVSPAPKSAQLDAWAERFSAHQQTDPLPFAEPTGDGKSHCAVHAIGNRSTRPGEGLIMVLHPETGQRSEAIRIGKIAAPLCLIPEFLEQGQYAEAQKRNVLRFTGALDLMVLLNAEKRFLAAAMLFCNEIAARLGCDRVSLGWLKSNHIDVQAISHTDKFEKKMEAIQAMAAAMEESIDQCQEIVFPRPDGSASIVRDHENYAKNQGSEFVASIPLFPAGSLSGGDVIPEGDTAPDSDTALDPLAAVTLERSDRPFTVDDLNTLRLICDHAARPLASLQKSDRWFGARAASALRDKASSLLGVEHTWWKISAILVVIGLAVLIFGRKEYRVEGEFEIRTDAMAQLSAPFDGHLADVHVRVGDEVTEGTPLFALDSRELALQREAALAENARFKGEALRAESMLQAAEMKMATARVQQSQAQLDLLDFRLSKAEIKAPFDGIVVEGDLREKISAPVSNGDLLMKIARIEDLYFDLMIPERDIQDFAENSVGVAKFASQPAEEYPFMIERIQPIGRAEEGGNVFYARCQFTGERQDWWRPGMSGVAKIDAGKRTLLWIATHRTVDFLRMFFW